MPRIATVPRAAIRRSADRVADMRYLLIRRLGQFSLQPQVFHCVGLYGSRDSRAVRRVSIPAGVRRSADRELAEAIADDREPSGGPGAKVWAWLRRAANKIPDTAGELGVGTAKAIVMAAVLKYFGLS